MIELIGFEESDRNEFTELAIQSFVEDKELYGDYPPLIDIEHRSLRFIDQGNTFKILKDGKMIGGTIIFSDNKGHYTLGAIFIHPSYHTPHCFSIIFPSPALTLKKIFTKKPPILWENAR